MQGITTLTGDEATALIGRDRESHQRDWYEAIERSDHPHWRMYVQIRPAGDVGEMSCSPFDLTRVWPHGDHPLIQVGVLELNRNPQNDFAEVEQSSFSPANVVPGIGHSPDKLLQFRILSDADAHRCRLGVNYERLPVNRPRCPVHSYHRDGALRGDDNGGGAVNYEPNSFAGRAEDARWREPPLRIDGGADRYDQRAGNDDFGQAGDLFRLMSPAPPTPLMDSIAAAMNGVPAAIQRRQTGHFREADPTYGDGVATRSGIAAPA